ncbi:hypothetical protein BJX99DRAFT_267263 [Aspergillus californicus]
MQARKGAIGPSIAFQRALDKFTQSLSDRQKHDFSVTKYEDVQITIEIIQSEYGEKKELQNMARIQGFLEAMSEYGKVVEVFLNSTPFLAYVWGPIKFILQVASSWSDSLEILLTAYEEIGERAPSFLQYQLVFERNLGMRNILEKWYCDVLEFHFHALQFLTRPKWKQLFGSSWKVFNSKFKRILDSLDRHKSLLESEKSTLAVYEIQNLRDDEAARFTETRLNAILDKIDAPNAEVDHDLKSECWVNPLLYIHGIPGAGKTTLASLIIETLRAEQANPVSFFYCISDQEGKKTFASILRGLLAQIISQDSVLATFFCEIYSGFDPRRFESVNVVKDAADMAFSSQRISYVVLDGLDECDSAEAEKTISWFLSRQKHAGLGTDGHIRLLCICQRTELLQRMLSPAEKISMDDQQSHRKDIETYIRDNVRSLSDKFGLSVDTEESIIANISKVANGMFLYAKVVIDNLSCQYTRDDLMKELAPGVFPNGLDAAYQRVISTVLDKVSPKQRDTTLQILGWLHSLSKPEMNTSRYDDHRLRASCKFFCSSLVDLHLGRTKEPTEATVVLVHSTARDYLVRVNIIHIEAQNARLAVFCAQYLLSVPFGKTVKDSEIHKHIHSGYYGLQDYAVSSIFDHLFEASESRIIDDVQLSDQLQFVLQSFVTEYGRPREIKLFHNPANRIDSPASLVRRIPSDPVKRYSLFDLENRTLAIRALIEHARSQDTLQDAERQTFNALYGPLTFKCPKIWCMSFQEGFNMAADRECHANRHENPFICPEEHCPLRAVGFNTEAILDRHVRQYHFSTQTVSETVFPKSRPPKEDTIFSAAKRGDLDAVQKHINDGVDVNHETSTKRGPDPLTVAAQNGHLSVCHLLVKHGAYHKALSNQVANHPLAVAARNGREDIVRYLIHVVGVKTLGQSGRLSALVGAVNSGNPEILKMIITSSDSKFSRTELSTALEVASVAGYPESIHEILIELCNDSFKDLLTQALLFERATEGHAKAVQILLDAHVDPCYEFIDFESASGNLTSLHVAAKNGHTETVRVLLDSGKINRDLVNKLERGALHLAMKGNHLETAKQIIEFDSTHGESLITWATSNSDETLIHGLLGIRDSLLDHVLYKAACLGNASVVRQLTAKRKSSLDPKKVKIASQWYAVPNPEAGGVIDVDLICDLDVEDIDIEMTVCRAMFSEDSKYLAVGGRGFVQIYSIATGEKVGGMKNVENSTSKSVYLGSVCFSPDSRCLVAGDDNRTLWLWNDLALQPSSSCASLVGEIHAVVYTRDGRCVVSGGTKAICMWDVSGDLPRPLHVFDNAFIITSLAIFSDNHYLATGDLRGNIRLWDITSQTPTEVLEGPDGHTSGISSITFSLDGSRLLICSFDNTVKQWELSPSKSVLDVYLTPNRRWLLSCDRVGNIKIADLATGRIEMIVRGHQEDRGTTYSFSFAPSGFMFALGIGDGAIRVWKLVDTQSLGCKEYRAQYYGMP